jgi:hypothetical protein
MRTRGSRVSRCPYWFHDVKQRSVLRSRGALLRSGLFASVTIAFASASRRRFAPQPQDATPRSGFRTVSETPLHERECESVYYKFVT